MIEFDPDLSRRRLMILLATGLTLPAACSARAVHAQFTPEAFGATGDGLSDDYDAMMRMVSAVNAARGGSIALGAGRTYYLDRHATAARPVADLIFQDCEGILIDGNGARISVKGDFYRDRRETRSLAGLVFEGCRNLTLRNLELAGGVERTRRIMSLPEPRGHGLLFGGCADVVVDGITARHFAADGMYVRHGRRPEPGGLLAASRRFTVRNSRFLFNGRQGLSVIQLRDGTFDNCDFSYTGYIAPEMQGPYGHHAPAAGVDVEPNHSPYTDPPVDVLTGGLQFRNCRMIGNRGASFISGKYGRTGRFVEKISLQSCEFQCLEEASSRYGFIFDVPDGEVANCTLRMLDRTAYIGWFRKSDASPRFVNNAVHGRNPIPGRPLLLVRPTLGGPIIEGNRFIVSGSRALSDANRPSIIVVENPNAIVRDNQILGEP